MGALEGKVWRIVYVFVWRLFNSIVSILFIAFFKQEHTYIVGDGLLIAADVDVYGCGCVAVLWFDSIVYAAV